MALVDWITLIVPFVFLGILLWHSHKQKIPFWRLAGFGIDKRVPLEIGVGLGISTLAMLGIFLVEWGMRAIRVEGLAPWEDMFFAMLGFLIFAALFEEVLSRAFLLGGLLVFLRERKWVAIIISAIFFGVAHLANPNASAISVFGNFLGGIMYGIAFVESGRIWLGFGLHFAWNFVQGPILGFIVSGQDFGGIIEQGTIGSDLVTGGEYGPEAGLVGIAFRFVVFAMLYGWFSWQRKGDA
jgi:membrane protease YdiL (CAAX protease family)